METKSSRRRGWIGPMKANGRVIASLQADKTGCIKFTSRPGLAVPRKFELIPATSKR